MIDLPPRIPPPLKERLLLDGTRIGRTPPFPEVHGIPVFLPVTPTFSLTPVPGSLRPSSVQCAQKGVQEVFDEVLEVVLPPY